LHNFQLGPIFKGEGHRSADSKVFIIQSMEITFQSNWRWSNTVKTV